MTLHLSTKRLSIAALIIIAAMTASVGLLSSRAAETNTLRTEAGETLEIGTDTASQKSDFSWILTKDRKFQSAQRSRFFQTRLAEPGTYVLDVSIQDPVTGESGYRAFTIIVNEPSGNYTSPTGDRSKPLSAILKTDPPVINGFAYVPPEGGMLKIDPSASDGNITSYHIDLDVSVDSDGDGDATNDIDNRGTISEKSGTPLYVFMLPGTSERRMRLSVADLSTVEPKTADLPVQFAQAPIASSQFSAGSNPNSPILLQREGPTVHFSAKLPESVVAGREVIYEWDFGDRSKSLLYSPVHTYDVAGTYNFSLRIRDISNAEVLYEGTDTLVIESVPTVSSSSDAEVSSSVSSSAPSGEKSKISIKGVLQVGFIVILLLAVAIGLYMLLTWLKRKTSTGLQKTLEKMEGTIVSKDVVDATKPVPMKLKKEVPKADTIPATSPAQKVVKEVKTETTPPPAAGPVPSWLAKASTTPAPTAAPKPTPPPVAAPSPKPTPTPAETGPTPAWLKPAPQTTAPAAAPVTPKPPVAPAPKAPEAPKPQHKPTAEPVPAPAPTPKPTVPVQPPVAAPVKTPEIPKPQPTPEVKPEPTQATTTPKPIAPVTPVPTAPVTQPLPEPKIQPAPVSAPVQTQTPKPISQPILPATPKPQTDKKADDEDPPIAIIQADSISKQ